jgi:TetR/AcrR family transcriptional regulator, repressor for uid operon
MDHAPLPLPPEGDASLDRHARILNAAERCFVRAGFHRTTMQDVAAEAGMSPGNLYRYFASKDAMVAGLAERDRAELGRDFASVPPTDDFRADFKRLGRKHFQDEPRDKAVLCMEIWAEATRNPAIAAINADFDQDVRQRLAELFEKGKQHGAVAPDLDCQTAALVACIISNGLFVRRACAKDFDAEREVDSVLAVLGALLDGKINFTPPKDPT